MGEVLFGRASKRAPTQRPDVWRNLRVYLCNAMAVHSHAYIYIYIYVCMTVYVQFIDNRVDLLHSRQSVTVYISVSHL